MKLTKDVFGNEFNICENVFELHVGQMRAFSKLTHNGGWYNINGDRLGWGDLSTIDMKRISDNLEEGQAFLVLDQHDSFLSFIKRPGLIGSLSTVSNDISAPGAEYVQKNMMYMILLNTIFFISPVSMSGSEYIVNGTKILRIGREEAKEKLKTLNE